MAKRKAAARTRKAVKKRPRKAARVRTSARRGTSKSARRVSKKAAKPAPKARAKRTAKAARPAPKARPSANRPKAVVPQLSKRSPARPKPAALSRERRQLRDEELLPSAPSTLGYAPKASQAETGQNMYHQKIRENTQGGPTLTGGDLDADWSEAYASGEEAPGGDMPTPDQDVVEEIGRALGVEYEDAEELKGAEKIEDRDRHRWEYDPASAEDYRDRNRRDND